MFGNLEESEDLKMNEASQKEKQKFKKVGPYILISQIGRGAFATVYRAQVEKTYQNVAIQMVSLSNLSQQMLQRINEEIEILSVTKHENIVNIVDFKKSKNHYYIVLEYCQYGDLQSYIQKSPNARLPEETAKQIIVQLSSAFQLLNTLKIVHRDLKLANILVGKNFSIKLADFGFAQFLSENTLLQSRLGTPITMAPEILLGQEYDQKCDIWSLGVIIYQMVFGDPPFLPKAKKDIQGLQEEINKGIINFPYEIKCSDELKDIIKRTLVKDPKNRIGFQEFFQHAWIRSGKQLQLKKETIVEDLRTSLQKVYEENKKNKQYIDSPLNAPGGEQHEKEEKLLLMNYSQIKQFKKYGGHIMILKTAFVLRKYLESRVFEFLAYTSKIAQLKHNFLLQMNHKLEECKEDTVQREIGEFQQSVDICYFYFQLITSEEIRQFINQQINISLSYHQIFTESFSRLYTIFLKDGQEDNQNINKVLEKKNSIFIHKISTDFQDIIEKQQQQMNAENPFNSFLRHLVNSVEKYKQISGKSQFQTFYDLILGLTEITSQVQLTVAQIIVKIEHQQLALAELMRFILSIKQKNLEILIRQSILIPHINDHFKQLQSDISINLKEENQDEAVILQEISGLLSKMKCYINKMKKK